MRARVKLSELVERFTVPEKADKQNRASPKTSG